MTCEHKHLIDDHYVAAPNSPSDEEMSPWLNKFVEWAREQGLEFFDTRFEVVSGSEMAALAANSGFPHMFRHYLRGQEYEEQLKRYRLGHGRIYEMVINADPSIAYLMDSNPMHAQKLVMPHVLAHVDFFRCNIWFSKTRRDSVSMMTHHAHVIDEITDKVGEEAVEKWVDLCTSASNLIDPFAQYKPGFRSRMAGRGTLDIPEHMTTAVDYHHFDAGGDRALSRFMNPKEYRDEQSAHIYRELAKSVKFPQDREYDILGFLAQHGRMKSWQRTILDLIREEQHYFAPMMITKIMNEGWATFWHTRGMQKFAEGEEVIDWCCSHAGVTHWPAGSLNPYALGHRLFEHIYKRWEKGRFGREWERCEDREERQNWDTKAGLGMKKVFEVRRNCNDITFLEEYIDEDFVTANKIFIYSNSPSGAVTVESTDWRDVKALLVHSLTFRGAPRVYVENGDVDGAGELLLRQDVEADSSPVQRDEAKAVLEGIAQMWGRPVILETATWAEKVDPGDTRFDSLDHYAKRVLGIDPPKD